MENDAGNAVVSVGGAPVDGGIEIASVLLLLLLRSGDSVITSEEATKKEIRVARW